MSFTITEETFSETIFERLNNSHTHKKIIFSKRKRDNMGDSILRVW